MPPRGRPLDVGKVESPLRRLGVTDQVPLDIEDPFLFEQRALQQPSQDYFEGYNPYSASEMGVAQETSIYGLEGRLEMMFLSGVATALYAPFYLIPGLGTAVWIATGSGFVLSAIYLKYPWLFEDLFGENAKPDDGSGPLNPFGNPQAMPSGRANVNPGPGYRSVAYAEPCNRPVAQHPAGYGFPDWSRQGLSPCGGPADVQLHWPTWYDAKPGDGFVRHVVGSWVPIGGIWSAEYNDTLEVFERIGPAVGQPLPELQARVSWTIPSRWPASAYFPRVRAPAFPHANPLTDWRTWPGAAPLGLPEKRAIPVMLLPYRSPGFVAQEGTQFGPLPALRAPAAPDSRPISVTVVAPAPGSAPGASPAPSVRTEVVPAGGSSGDPPMLSQSGFPVARRGEKKIKASLTRRVVRAAFTGITEVGDFVDCLYEAVPAKKRLKYRPGKPILIQDKVGVIIRERNNPDLDTPGFVKCVVQNEIVDRILGGMHKQVQSKLQRPGVGGLSSFWMPSSKGVSFGPKL